MIQTRTMRTSRRTDIFLFHQTSLEGFGDRSRVPFTVVQRTEAPLGEHHRVQVFLPINPLFAAFKYQQYTQMVLSSPHALWTDSCMPNRKDWKSEMLPELWDAFELCGHLYYVYRLRKGNVDTELSSGTAVYWHTYRSQHLWHLPRPRISENAN